MIHSRQGKAAFETNVVLNEMSDLKYENEWVNDLIPNVKVLMKTRLYTDEFITLWFRLILGVNDFSVELLMAVSVAVNDRTLAH